MGAWGKGNTSRVRSEADAAADHGCPPRPNKLNKFKGGRSWHVIPI